MLAVAEHKQIQSELIPKIATGFCSGMARTGGMCGAVSGGIMAIGLYLGRSKANEAVDPCYTAVGNFLDQFSEQFGAIRCSELIGVQLGTPEGQLAFKEKGLIKQCYRYVEQATSLVEEVINPDRSLLST